MCIRDSYVPRDARGTSARGAVHQERLASEGRREPAHSAHAQAAQRGRLCSGERLGALGARFGPASDDAASKPSEPAPVAQRARLAPAAPPTAGSMAYGTAFPPLGSAAGAVAALSSNPKRGRAVVVRPPVEYRARKSYTWEDVVALGKQVKDGTVTMSQIRNEKDADKYKVPYGSMLKCDRDDH